MSNQSSDEAQVSFHCAATYFSDEEWKLLQEWQKELYRNVMKEIHQALLSLGPLITTTVFSLKAKERLCPVDVQDSERGQRICHSPTQNIGCQIPTKDSCLKTEEPSVGFMEDPVPEVGESSTNPDLAYPLVTAVYSLSRNNDEKTHYGEDSMGMSTDIVSVHIKKEEEEETCTMDLGNSERKEDIRFLTGPTYNAPQTSSAAQDNGVCDNKAFSSATIEPTVMGEDQNAEKQISCSEHRRQKHQYHKTDMTQMQITSIPSIHDTQTSRTTITKLINKLNLNKRPLFTPPLHTVTTTTTGTAPILTVSLNMTNTDEPRNQLPSMNNRGGQLNKIRSWVWDYFDVPHTQDVKSATSVICNICRKSIKRGNPLKYSLGTSPMCNHVKNKHPSTYRKHLGEIQTLTKLPTIIHPTQTDSTPEGKIEPNTGPNNLKTTSTTNSNQVNSTPGKHAHKHKHIKTEHDTTVTKRQKTSEHT
ncbi:uncharacterized protein [Ambystoma mexicanum]|uniref:uncharacterized protein isoform X3 n=1 Tax=Ambystoma mexicanum TaxID=8296 RepID=UPI0037E9B466